MGLDKSTTRTPQSRLARWVMLFLVMSVMTSTQAFSAMKDVGPNGGMFKVLGHTYSGEFLIIEYEIRYPGMTKVKMFDGGDNLLWRSQYVDDVDGKHKVVLRASKMAPGNYRFEFDYKDNFSSYIVAR